MFEAVLRTDEKDRKVNYSLAGATLPFSVYNAFFIYSVEISGYLHLWKDSQRKTIADSLTQFLHPIPNHAFLNKINFRDHLINQKQAIAVNVNPDGHNEIPSLFDTGLPLAFPLSPFLCCGLLRHTDSRL